MSAPGIDAKPRSSDSCMRSTAPVLRALRFVVLPAALLMSLPEVRADACDPLRDRLSQANAMDDIHRKNIKKLRDLHKSIHQSRQQIQSLREDCQNEVKQKREISSTCDHLRTLALGGVEINPLNIASQLDKIQADIDAELVKVEESVKEIDYAKGAVDKCVSEEQARKEANTAAAERIKRAGDCSSEAIERDFSAARVNFLSEYYEEARSKLRQISEQYGKCPGVSERVSKGDKQIDTVQKISTRVGTAVNNCNVGEMERFLDWLKKVKLPHPAMHVWAKDAREKISACRNSRVADAHDDCRRNVAAGYSARMLPDGGYHCVPDKVTADAWCANQRKDWYARNVSEAGVIECWPNATAQTAICEDKFGAGATAISYRDGQVQCRRPPAPPTTTASAVPPPAPAATARTRPRKAARRPPPVYRNPGYDAAVAGAVATVLIQSIISSRNARRPPAIAAPARRCHYNRYGKLHCGGS